MEILCECPMLLIEDKGDDDDDDINIEKIK